MLQTDERRESLAVHLMQQASSLVALFLFILVLLTLSTEISLPILLIRGVLSMDCRRINLMATYVAWTGNRKRNGKCVTFRERVWERGDN